MVTPNNFPAWLKQIKVVPNNGFLLAVFITTVSVRKDVIAYFENRNITLGVVVVDLVWLGAFFLIITMFYRLAKLRPEPHPHQPDEAVVAREARVVTFTTTSKPKTKRKSLTKSEFDEYLLKVEYFSGENIKEKIFIAYKYHISEVDDLPVSEHFLNVLKEINLNNFKSVLMFICITQKVASSKDEYVERAALDIILFSAAGMESLGFIGMKGGIEDRDLGNVVEMEKRPQISWEHHIWEVRQGNGVALHHLHTYEAEAENRKLAFRKDHLDDGSGVSFGEFYTEIGTHVSLLFKSIIKEVRDKIGSDFELTRDTLNELELALYHYGKIQSDRIKLKFFYLGCDDLARNEGHGDVRHKTPDILRKNFSKSIVYRNSSTDDSKFRRKFQRILKETGQIPQEDSNVICDNQDSPKMVDALGNITSFLYDVSAN